jgi:primosomal protein N' (replication factor Y)
MIQLEVAVSAPVRETYSYLPPHSECDDGDTGETFIGKRVEVPLGRRSCIGYVVSAGPVRKSKFKLKPALECIDDSPLFPASMVDLFRWVADYYHYPLGLVIRQALPSGLTRKSSVCLCLSDGEGARLVLKQYREQCSWVQALLAGNVLTGSETRRLLQSSKDRRLIDELVEKNVLVLSREAVPDRVAKRYETCYRMLAGTYRMLSELEVCHATWPGEISSLRDRFKTYGISAAEAKTLVALLFLQHRINRDEVPRKELAALYPHGVRIVSRLAHKRLIHIDQRRMYRGPLGELLPLYSEPAEHTAEQLHAISRITSALHAREPATFLLHGITGSGKTEVYLKAAEVSLAQGRGVLILVPEIALATQIEPYFISRFGEKVAVLHSGLSRGARYDEWGRVLDGDARVLIGARSAVFAPLDSPGLIIVDEEHDGGYKQEEGLRYNGRDVALMRARQVNATVILGSATPAVQSYYHAKSGKYQLITMAGRIGGQRLPHVEVVDLRKPAGRLLRDRIFHDRLKTELLDNFANRYQSMLLLNRRGFASSVICVECGRQVECVHCNIGLHLHHHSRTLLCHYCGFRQAADSACPTCGSTRLQPIGFGTERVVSELETLMPTARIGRLDSDTATDRTQVLDVINRMKNHEIDILIGTQMIAKGLHFPRVTLVGIISADTSLSFPDFRAAEKTYQLISQVAGRAGRGDEAGRVIIQTMQPNHYAISMATRHGYEEMAECEQQIRKSVGFPPFSRLVLIRIEHKDLTFARLSAHQLLKEAQSWCARHGHVTSVQLLGPAPAPLEKLRDYYRYQFIIKSMDLAVLHDLVDFVDRNRAVAKAGTVIIDVDPESML